jgi:hypothetical protein
VYDAWDAFLDTLDPAPVVRIDYAIGDGRTRYRVDVPGWGVFGNVTAVVSVRVESGVDGEQP